MTATNDASPIGRTEVQNRRVPFDSIRRGDQFLMIFKDGDHMIFSDHRIGTNQGEKRSPFLPRMRGTAKSSEGFSGEGGKDPLYHRYIRLATEAFWDAYLKENPESKKWILEGGLKAALEAMASLEVKSESTEES
jgi:hypothetical protein